MKLTRSVLISDGLLVLTAAVWGFAFVAQRVGMESIGPFAFNAARYFLGALILVPLIFKRRRDQVARPHASGQPQAQAPGTQAVTSQKKFASLMPYILAGSCMFIGASLQQLGIVTTTAGNAAFVTSLYVVIVPLLGMLFGRRTGLKDYLAAAVAVAGLYIITIGKGFSMTPGDILVLAGSFFWALHILVIGRFASTIDPVELSAGQFAVCALWSFAASLIFEPAPYAGLLAAAIPILYGGLFSCGVAFTLQIVAQRTAPPSHASILLAMEGLFGAIGGILLLGEPLTLRLLLGGALMLAAAILSQLA